MNISAPFIRRPVATSLLTVALLFVRRLVLSAVAGGSATLKWNIPPSTSMPLCQAPVRIPWLRRWRRPLERQFGRIAGITQMTSSSQLGSTNITLQFDLNRNVDAAARDVQAAINAALDSCPPTCPPIRDGGK